MRIFLTGGTGFIGSHFINEAIGKGYELICLRRPKSQPRIKLKYEPCWIDGQLDDDLQNQIADSEVFIHLAAHSTNVPYDTLENCLYWNLNASLQLLQQARNARVHKFIVAGTGFEYGRSGEDFKKIPVNAPLKPTMSYPTSKAAASIIFYQWSLEYKLQLQYLRIFHVFGEGEAENRLWPSLREAALNGQDFHLTPAEQIRDFIPVEDVVCQLLDALDFSKTKSGIPQIRHIGTGKPQSIREFVEYWWKKWGAKGKLHLGSKPYRENEVMRLVPEI